MPNHPTAPITADDIEPFDKVRAALRPRDFAELKPGVAELTGQRFALTAMWLMDDGDRYPGEFAMKPIDAWCFPGTDIIWIASGDFGDFERIAT